MSDKIKVFHLEDYQILRDGIKFLLETKEEIDYIGGEKDPGQFLRMLPTLPVNVLIMDIYLDGMEDLQTMDGFTVCQHVTRDYPHVKIVAHSIYDDADRVARILKAGAKGFVSKKSGFDELITAVKVVNTGQNYICRNTSGKLKNINRFLSGIENTLRSREELFSSREREVLDLLAKGMSSREISEVLFIAERTVESHRKNMLEKGNVKNTAQLIAYGAALGLLKN